VSVFFIDFYCTAPMFLRQSVIGALQMSYDDDDDDDIGCLPYFGTLYGVQQRAPPMFGRVTIRLGIGPHSTRKKR